MNLCVQTLDNAVGSVNDIQCEFRAIERDKVYIARDSYRVYYRKDNTSYWSYNVLVSWYSNTLAVDMEVVATDSEYIVNKIAVLGRTSSLAKIEAAFNDYNELLEVR